jgi:hypothetical protein|tara:strand:+ start:134 stop:370 length:237 start_codon:yes stop_codon:yes gene_type:complete
MTDEMYEKTIKDLQETLYTAYTRIKELTEQLEKIKKDMIELRLLLPENRTTATEYVDGDSGQQDLETYLQRVRKNEGQ